MVQRTAFRAQNRQIRGYIPPPPYLLKSKNRILVGKNPLKRVFRNPEGSDLGLASAVAAEEDAVVDEFVSI